MPALTTAFDWFQSLKTPCSAASDMQMGKVPIRLFPNPFIDEFNLEVNEIGRVSIYSTDGKLLFNEIIDSQTKTIQTGNWPVGMYLITFKGEKRCYRSLISKF